ncbi:unnamed protein product, partial [Medioppia subpectinata]
VCGDRAVGYNFDALTCESCRSFFRRNYTRIEDFECFFGDNCEINRLTRKFCKRCRLNRCFTVGMRNKTIVTKSGRLLSLKQSKNIDFSEDLLYKSSNALISSKRNDNKIPSIFRGFIFNLNDNEIKVLKELFSSVAVVRDPPTKTIAYETVCVSDAIQVLQNGADLNFPRIVKMSANINGFKELCEDDKIALLKTACPQLMLLQSIFHFDFEGQLWTLPIDEEKTTLLRTTVVLFNPNLPNLVHRDNIILQQQTYMYLLQRPDNLTSYVCGDRAVVKYPDVLYIGYNFDVPTCEPCRSFFRRNAPYVEQYVCVFGNNCNISRLTRKFCKKCRIDKCFAVGMKIKTDPKSDELSRDGHLNNVDKECNSLMAVENIDTQIPSVIKGFIFNFNELEMKRFKELFNSVTVVRDQTIRAIAFETESVSEALQMMQNRINFKFTQMVKMSANINGFKQLCEDDKIVLLKAACPQLMFLLNITDFAFDGMFFRIPIDEEKATIIRLSLMTTWSKIVGEIHEKFLLQQKTYMYLLQRYLEIKHNSKSESEIRFGSFMNCLQVLRDLSRINMFPLIRTRLESTQLVQLDEVRIGDMYREFYELRHYEV